EAESQRRIEETLRTLRARSVQTAPAVGPRQTALSVDAVSMLRSGNGIREAMILSEILSAPVAERRTPSCPGMVS
ncbi:MAG TPA: hypothetical protein PKI32_01495, partial [Opitutales bacterium]|nr:hypothetical protein [Opitutales bacterium]